MCKWLKINILNAGSNPRKQYNARNRQDRVKTRSKMQMFIGELVKLGKE